MSAGPVLVFAYGSLVDAASASHTLGRVLGAPIPATLPGWRRRWCLCRDNLRSEKTFAPPGGEPPPFVLGLSVEPEEGAEVNGALLAVEPGELERLDLRELRYDRVEVRVSAAGEQRRAVTYRAKRERFCAEPPPGAVVLRPYLERVELAFAGLGPDQLERFHETTGEVPVPVIDAVLVRDQIPRGNPRDW